VLIVVCSEGRTCIATLPLRGSPTLPAQRGGPSLARGTQVSTASPAPPAVGFACAASSP